ncbi:MAG TPA: serine/threonine-protein kinase, partial [Thermoanaerobaculia bacterium]|nr:serine/threonine-protein kinase [Thermoanaerobaculia bacterium]
MMISLSAMADSPLVSTATFRRGKGPGNGGPGDGFTPGTILLGRYRVIRLLGKGGMAEVYQADDLKLGESVALKFLSTQANSNPGALEWLFRELRNGRQVAHPNVCRLYDIVEVDERHCIAMEFVEGVDLASLLRQVGRLPYEKALRVSRDLCAGVAAAHQVGLLHRDLKPANVMIDGHGAPKITDFGIAAFSHEISSDELCGTPNYMAPEQLSGGEMSFRSDLYALGLVMYELFTGVAVFDANSIQELTTAHKAEKRRPSHIVNDLDIAVERVILRCLAENPAERPRSAREILSALPGRDAMEAAMEAGETPSPEVVAAANVSSTLSGRAAGVLAGAAALGLFSILALTPMTMFYARVPLEKSPDVLADEAQQVAAKVGMQTTGLRRHSWFARDEKYLLSPSATTDSSWRDLHTLIPGALEYVSYWTPAGLTPQNSTGRLQLDSPLMLSRLNRVTLDSSGRLKSFRIGDDLSAGYRAPPMQTLLALAGLPGQTLRAVNGDVAETKEWVTQVKGQAPVYVVRAPFEFALSQARSSSTNDRRSPYTASLGLAQTWGGPALAALIAATAVIGIGLRLRNARRGRIDDSGALKVATYVASVSALAWACGADHSTRIGDEWAMVTTGMGGALFAGALTWLLYGALEPSLRRRFPRVLVAWNRLLLGRFRDPLVARDVLIAICAGISLNLWWRLINISPRVWNLPALVPYGIVFEAFSTIRGVAFRFFSLQNTAVLFGLGLVFILTALRALTG